MTNERKSNKQLENVAMSVNVKEELKKVCCKDEEPKRH